MKTKNTTKKYIECLDEMKSRTSITIKKWTELDGQKSYEIVCDDIGYDEYCNIINQYGLTEEYFQKKLQAEMWEGDEDNYSDDRRESRRGNLYGLETYTINTK